MEEVQIAAPEEFEAPVEERELTNVDYFKTILEAIESYIEGNIDPDEIAELITVLCESHNATKAAVTQANVKKLETTLEGGAFHDFLVARVNAQIDAIDARIAEIEEERSKLELHNFAELETAFKPNFLTVGSVKVTISSSLVALKRTIELMVDRERQLERARRDLWAMNPTIANMPIRQKITTQSEEKTNQEIQILREMKPLHDDTNTLVSLAQKAIRITHRRDNDAITADDRATVGRIITIASKWSTRIAGRQDALLYDKIRRLEIERFPHDKKLHALDNSLQAKKRNLTKDKHDFEETLIRIYERLEAAIEKENALQQAAN